ncbi:MAG: class I SAM-dependent methyltransferase [Pseudomonadota bacterium]
MPTDRNLTNAPENSEGIALLLDQLNALAGISNEEWLGSLAPRKISELEFHDRDRDPQRAAKLDSDTYERFYGNKKYYLVTDLSRKYWQRWIEENVCTGGVFLDYACGNGGVARIAAHSGATLSIGIDISSVSIQNARKLSAAEGLTDKTFFIQADCENTKLPDASVDRIICSGMLHHLDLSYAFPELRRILKPGGKILALEALDYNPLIKLYRKMTPEMRTEWEKAHILSLSDVRFARRFFDVRNVRYWHISSIVAPKISLKLLPILNSLDWVLTRVPGCQLLAWIFSFELVKRQET